MSDTRKDLLTCVEKKIFGPLDVVSLTLAYEGFTDIGVIKCKKSINDFACLIKDFMKECKHPGLNPFVDRMIEYKEVSNNGLEIIQNFIENESEFKTEKVDNNSSYIEISIDLDIFFVNLDAMLKEEKIKIKKALIQGPLYSKEY